MKDWSAISRINLIALRRYKKMDLEEFSEFLGISLSALSRLENDKLKIQLEHLSALSNYFKLDIMYFFEEFTPSLTKQLNNGSEFDEKKDEYLLTKEVEKKMKKYEIDDSVNWEELVRENLKIWRFNRNLSLKEASELSGINFTSLSKMENQKSKIRLRHLFQLCESFKTDISFFFKNIDLSNQNEMKKKKRGLKPDIVRLAGEGYLIKEIAKKLDCGASYVSEVFSEQSIDLKRLKEQRKKEMQKAILLLSEGGFAVAEIARTIKRSDNYVRTMLGSEVKS